VYLGGKIHQSSHPVGKGFINIIRLYYVVIYILESQGTLLKVNMDYCLIRRRTSMKLTKNESDTVTIR
jgi:hypothetical protein